jgi:hypothetical protein
MVDKAIATSKNRGDDYKIAVALISASSNSHSASRAEIPLRSGRTWLLHRFYGAGLFMHRPGLRNATARIVLSRKSIDLNIEVVRR